MIRPFVTLHEALIVQAKLLIGSFQASKIHILPAASIEQSANELVMQSLTYVDFPMAQLKADAIHKRAARPQIQFSSRSNSCRILQSMLRTYRSGFATGSCLVVSSRFLSAIAIPVGSNRQDRSQNRLCECRKVVNARGPLFQSIVSSNSLCFGGLACFVYP